MGLDFLQNRLNAYVLKYLPQIDFYRSFHLVSPTRNRHVKKIKYLLGNASNLNTIKCLLQKVIRRTYNFEL